MKKIDRIPREILHSFYERGERFFNQKGLAKACGISLGTINPVVAHLEQFGAIERKPLGFRLIDPIDLYGSGAHHLFRKSVNLLLQENFIFS